MNDVCKSINRNVNISMNINVNIKHISRIIEMLPKKNRVFFLAMITGAGMATLGKNLFTQWIGRMVFIGSFVMFVTTYMKSRNDDPED